MLRLTLLPLPMVSSQHKVVPARQLIRAADTFNHVLVGGNTSLLPLLMRAQIKAGLIGGEVQSLLVHAYRWLTICVRCRYTSLVLGLMISRPRQYGLGLARSC